MEGTLSGSVVVTLGIGLVSAGVTLAQTQLIPGIVSAVAGFGLVAVGLYLIQKGVMTAMKKLGK